MDIYFVRHGESIGNVSKRHQPSNTRLTDKGIDQARAVGEELVAVAPTHFLTSSQVRAVETAEYIAESLPLIPETYAVFAELNRPKHMYGWHHRSPRSLWYLCLWYFEIVGDPESQEAGESYVALRARIKAAQELLASFPADARIVVVSHSVFINMFVAHMNHPKHLSVFKALVRIVKTLRTKNTSITHVHYDPNQKQRKQWQHIVK